MKLSISQQQGYVLAKTSGALDADCGALFAEHVKPLLETTRNGKPTLGSRAQVKHSPSIVLAEARQLPAQFNCASVPPLIIACIVAYMSGAFPSFGGVSMAAPTTRVRR